MFPDRYTEVEVPLPYHVAQKGIITSGTHTISLPLKGIPRRELPTDDEPKKEIPPPEPLFKGGGCCSGDGQKQIFWYRPMGDTNFGIHMNAEEFDKRFQGQPPDIKKAYFRQGISHEYFHHIVDSWCVINEIDREKLSRRYEKQLHEESESAGVFILEESMGEHLAYKWTGRKRYTSRGSYSLSQPFSSSNVWFEGSLIVALQYIKGHYKISGLTPKSGFTREILKKYEVPKEWRARVPSCKLFPLDGYGAGFGTDHDNGVWNLGNIPFHVHHPDGDCREWYSVCKDEFYQRLLTKPPSLIRT